LFAGAFGRGHMTGALNAAAGMMQGAREADAAAYNRSYKQWRDHLDLGLRAIELMNKEAREITESADRNYDRQISELNTLAQMYQLPGKYTHEEVQRQYDQLRLMKERRDIIQANNTDADVFNAAAEKDQKWLDAHPEANGVIPADVKAVHHGEAAREYKGTGTSVAAGGMLDDAAVKMMAQQLPCWRSHGMQNLGRGVQGSQNIVRLRGEIARQMAEQGKSGAEVATAIAEFEGLKAGERALGTRTAQMGMALNQVKTFVPLALSASEKVDRTQYPMLNELLLAAERGTGDENVVRLAVATNSLLNAYARAVTPTGVPTEGAQHRARELLDAAWSKGQFRAAIEQLQLKVDAASKSPGMVREEFRGGGMGQGAPPTTSPAQPSVPIARPEASGGSPVIKYDAQGNRVQ
jgi:hypothetical protein